MNKTANILLSGILYILIEINLILYMPTRLLQEHRACSRYSNINAGILFLRMKIQPARPQQPLLYSLEVAIVTYFLNLERR